MAIRTRKEEEKQTKMSMDYKFKKQCIVNLSKEKKGRKCRPFELNKSFEIYFDEQNFKNKKNPTTIFTFFFYFISNYQIKDIFRKNNCSCAYEKSSQNENKF
jgi:hypothetical protein